MKKKLDVVFILDKSGSMSGSEEHTISSFNEYLERERKNSFDSYITTILFNDQYEYLHERLPISDVKKITSKDYSVSGCTALYDALGHGINSLDSKKSEKALFVIITDGLENASKEFKKEQIKKMINNHPKWNFIYIGADIDSYAAGGEIGIKNENIANFKKTRTGTNKLFNAVSNLECAMMDEKCSSNWKEDLDNYITKYKI